MAKVLLINGSPNEHGCTYTALHEVDGVLRRHGIETEILWLGRKPVAGCIACNTCARTGHCVFGPETFDDKVNRVLDELDSIDAIVAGSPVYYAAASGQITSFLNRLFYAGGRRMAGKLGAAVVSCRRAALLLPLTSSTSTSLSAICRWYHPSTGIRCMAIPLRRCCRMPRVCR